ncbi:unnamed protein product [Tilletia controversa]|uniref:Crossover junction endonuclease MUS81 n=1 Tax=Tilletia controversa TaxID=13291 RepID=A0A8X7MU30_9BASI|nr:hypothetical protein CF328_g3555 [Tilletia controversa]KAE8247637.1 hypothetical protein A4X06_0g4305 [Tilletia controversa]CAD6932657.1 unnamed protein product [Tilletia controversa]
MPPRAASGASASAGASAGAGLDAAEGPTSKTLWMAFLSEWATEANAKGSKAGHAYTKASYSIKHAEQDFAHPCELIALKGVGPTIVTKLTERLEQWCVLHHQIMPQRPAGAAAKGKKKATATATAASTGASSSSSVPKRKRAAIGADDRSNLRGSDDDLLGFGSGDNDSTDEDEQLRAAIAESLKDVRKGSAKDDVQPNKKAPKASTSKAKKPKAPAVPKTYVPNMRTGAYGILLGLHSQTPTIDDEVYLTKAQLIPLAQPWCDSDYIVSSKASGPGSRGGSSASSRIPASVTGAAGAAMSNVDPSRNGVAPPINYTAWSSMKTLVTKGLVYQTGNPPKYCLSEDGWELATEMKRVADGQPSAPSESSASPERRPEGRQQATLPAPAPGRGAGSSRQQAQSPVPQQPEPVRARAIPSGLRIPVTKPGLFSSSDPPSSSPQQVFMPESSRTTAASDRKGKGKQTAASTSAPEMVILSGAGTPEPDFGIDDDELAALLSASQETYQRSKVRAQPAPLSTLFSAPAKKRANPFGFDTDARNSQRSATWPQAKESPLLDNFVENGLPLPGSQQDLAIAISDSDDEIPPPRTTTQNASRQTDSDKRGAKSVHNKGATAATVVIIDDDDEDEYAGDRTLDADRADDTIMDDLSSLRSARIKAHAQRSMSGPAANQLSLPTGPSAGPSTSYSRSYSDSLPSGIGGSLARPGESAQGALRREVRAGLALSPRSAAARRRQDAEDVVDQSAATARPRGKHGRLSQALPRREVGALGLGWQAQIQAEIGASQSQELDQDSEMDDVESQATVGRSAVASTSARPPRPIPAKRVESFDDDSDFDIEDIMRDVENGIAAKLGRAPEVGQLRRARAEASASAVRERSTQASSPVAEDGDELSDLEIMNAPPALVTSGVDIDRKESVPQARTRPRDSLPAVPQPLLPGMAVVSVAADSSFDMFDDAKSGLQERLLPPRSVASSSRLNLVASGSSATRGTTTNAPRKSSDWSAPAFSPHVWPAGSYEIILLLDTREIKHGSTTSTNRGPGTSLGVNETIRGPRCHLSDPLLDKGIPVEVRALELGDVVWIARRKGSAGTEEDEVVLDYIVERKRLDDLVQSIPDGRWKEQKFRLSLSGLSKVFYLIEDYDVEQQMRQWGPQIATAISSTQVIDGFFVQRTAGVEASLEWLRKMHQVICQTHQNKPLHVLPDAILSRPTYLRLQTYLRRTQPMTPHHITFASYRSLNAKNGSVTVGEVWARMLLCVRGMSEEKVGEVIRVWNTGRDWWEACKAVGFDGSTSSAQRDDPAAEEDWNAAAEDVDEDDQPENEDEEDEFSFSDDSLKQSSKAGKKKTTTSAGKNVAKKAIIGKNKTPAVPKASTSSRKANVMSRSAIEQGKALMSDWVGGMYTSALGMGASRDATAVAASMANYDSRKKIGNALSAKVWDVWRKDRYMKGI